MRIPLIAFVVSMVIGSPALAASIGYQIVNLSENASGDAYADFDASASAPSASGTFTNGDSSRKISEQSVRASAAPPRHLPGASSIISEGFASSGVTLSLTNLETYILRANLRVVYEGQLRSILNDALGTLRFEVDPLNMVSFGGDYGTREFLVGIQPGAYVPELSPMGEFTVPIFIYPGATSSLVLLEAFANAAAAGDTFDSDVKAQVEGRMSVWIDSVRNPYTPVPLPAGLPLAVASLGCLALPRSLRRRQS